MATRWISLWAAAVIGTGAGASAGSAQPAKPLEVRRIWDQAAHNAFADLLRHENQWLCVFREGTGHVSHDGRIRVIASADGKAWKPLALLERPDANLPDLRDPKVTAAPAGRLMLTAVGANRQPNAAGMQTYAWFSTDGKDWGKPVAIGDRDFWLWRVTWHGGLAYAAGYNRKLVRLYRSTDGRRFDVLVERLFEKDYPNEATIRFLPDGRALCLLRREAGTASAQLGIARAPYTDWTWRDLGVRLGGPNLLVLPDGRLLAAGRRYDEAVRTSLMWLDADRASLTEFLHLPSGGDNSYPGLALHEGELWVAYYSSHEGKTAIYLARVALGRKAGK